MERAGIYGSNLATVRLHETSEKCQTSKDFDHSLSFHKTCPSLALGQVSPNSGVAKPNPFPDIIRKFI